MNTISRQCANAITIARLRRKLNANQVAKRANICPPIEKGSERTSIGTYLKILDVLGLGNDLLNVAKDDILGRKLQDAKIITKQRAPKKVNKK